MRISSLVRPRSQAYKKTFAGPFGEKVLADLRRFCKATVPTADPDNVYATYIAEGRREVWLRIQAHLNLTDEDVFDLIEDYTDD